MARRPALIKTKKKITRASPTITRRKKMLGPDFTGWEKMTGQAFNKFKNDAKNFYYENFQEADLLPEVWKWMKDNKYTSQDIKNAKAAKGLYALGVWPAIMCKMLYSGCPDYNKAEAEYWETLRGTSGQIMPLSNFIKVRIDCAINAGKLSVSVDSDEVPKPVTRQNIQEVMKERASDACSEIEAIADEFMNESCPKEFTTRERVHAILNEQKVLPHHIGRYTKYWEDVKVEYEAAKIGKDSAIKEGYSKYTRAQLNNMIKFAGQIIDDLNAYIAIKQAARTVRPKKAVPVEKVVARIKYQKTDDTLGITSVSPTKLHQCTEAFVYDTAKRKIIWLVADDYSKCLIVKGNSIIGFDKKKSMSKTVRKPNEFLKVFMSASRPATRKAVDEIKTVAAIPNGRFNENMVILKVW